MNRQQALFVAHYVAGNCSNATQAAIKAGYTARTANRTASRLLTHAVVAAAIQRKMGLREAQIDYSAASWLRDTLQIGAEARASGKLGPALKAQELIGRHLGLLSDARGVTRDQADLYSYLGAAMERYRERAVTDGVVTVQAVEASDGDSSQRPGARIAGEPGGTGDEVAGTP
jgi:phage terminase small subunit